MYQSSDKKEQGSLHFAAVECVWGTVCGNGTNESIFFQHGGIFSLLDLLEDSSSTLRRHALGCSLDLLENPKARFHLLEWRTKSSEKKGLANLLIMFWRQEEKSLGVCKSSHAVLSGNKRPLLGDNQHVLSPKERGGVSWTMTETDMNLRSKIYCMLSKLGFEQLLEGLDVDEKITMALVRS